MPPGLQAAPWLCGSRPQPEHERHGGKLSSALQFILQPSAKFQEALEAANHIPQPNQTSPAHNPQTLRADALVRAAPAGPRTAASPPAPVHGAGRRLPEANMTPAPLHAGLTAGRVQDAPPAGGSPAGCGPPWPAGPAAGQMCAAPRLAPGQHWGCGSRGTISVCSWPPVAYFHLADGSCTDALLNHMHTSPPQAPARQTP